MQSAQLDPKQALLLFRLAFEGGKLKYSDAIGNDRKTSEKLIGCLVDQHLISKEEAKNRRGFTLKANDHTWAWVSANLTHSLGGGNMGKSLLASVLQSVSHYLKARGETVQDLLLARSAAEVPQAPLPDRLFAVIKELAQGRTGNRVHLSAVRERLRQDGRQQIDPALLSLQSEGKVVLMTLDPIELTPADENGAVKVAGHARHIAHLT